MTTHRHPIHIIQGGQYGSESKGCIASHYALRDRVDFAVRTGATNAGHVVYYETGRYTMQQLPVGWVREEATLVIGAGALVDLDILDRELSMIAKATGRDPRPRTYVDARAFIHRPEHAERSAASGRHHAMGATGKGSSEAMVDRIQGRGPTADGRSAVGILNAIGNNRTDGRLRGVNIADTERLLNNAFDQGAHIQLEGTQGQLLDLCLGPYPYTTHKQTGPAQWMLEAGLSPTLPTRVTLVVRTYPIRVAGNSGPLPREMSWVDLARHINQRRADVGLPPMVADSALVAFEDALDVAAEEFEVPAGRGAARSQHLWTEHQRMVFRKALSELNARALKLLPDATQVELKRLFEMTTVTKKLRRIAQLDLRALSTSARQARPTDVAVTFMNYICPEMWGSTEPLIFAERAFLSNVASVCEAPVTLINRGPLPEHVIECEVGPNGLDMGDN